MIYLKADNNQLLTKLSNVDYIEEYLSKNVDKAELYIESQPNLNNRGMLRREICTAY
jgi:hypothetical protein